MPGSRAPGFSPPHWPRRLGRRRDATRPIGGLPLPVLEIPYQWISAPLQRRPTTPINSATVALEGSGATGRSISASSIAAYGQSAAAVALASACDADPANLAEHLTTYFDTPRPRAPRLVFNLLDRTDAECLLLLGVGLLRRARIIHTPTGFPAAAANFTVEGIHHVIAVDQRVLEWSTAALVGTSVTEPGPWFRWDSSSWDGSDIRPF